MTDEPKPFELTLKLRNNLLKERRLALGMSMAEFADACGVAGSTYGRYEGLVEPPYGARGLRPSALKIANYLRLDPSHLWPRAVLNVAHPVLVRKMTEAEVCPLLASQHGTVTRGELPACPEDAVLLHDLAAKMDVDLHLMLTDQEKSFLAAHLSGMNLREVGELHDRSSERARHLIVQAVGKIESYLKHEGLDGDDDVEQALHVAFDRLRDAKESQR